MSIVEKYGPRVKEAGPPTLSNKMTHLIWSIFAGEAVEKGFGGQGQVKGE